MPSDATIDLISAVRADAPVTLAHAALAAGADVNARLPQGRCLLHIVVASGDRPLFNLLMQHHPALDVCDDDGLSPLHVAIEHGQFDMARDLLAAGARLDIKGGLRGEPTVFHTAVYADRRGQTTARTDFMLAAGADALARDGRGTSVIDAAGETLAAYIQDYPWRLQREEAARTGSLPAAIRLRRRQGGGGARP